MLIRPTGNARPDFLHSLDPLRPLRHDLANVRFLNLVQQANCFARFAPWAYAVSATEKS